MKILVVTALKKNWFDWAVLSTLHGTALFFKKVNFILFASCNNENKLKATLAKGTRKVKFS